MNHPRGYTFETQVASLGKFLPVLPDTEQCTFCELVRENANPGLTYQNDLLVVTLYPDQIYPYRTAVIYREHTEDIQSLPLLHQRELYDVTMWVGRAVALVTASPRLNYALLGNRVPHVHWHVIPRQPTDPLWGKAPWPHPTLKLDDSETHDRVEALKTALNQTR